MKTSLLRKITLITLLAFVASTNYAQTLTWDTVLVDPYTSHGINEFNVNNNFMWATSRNSTGNNYRIHKSFNGGQTWSSVAGPPCPSGVIFEFFYQTYYFDSQNAFYRFQNGNKNSYFYSTTDGGSTLNYLSTDSAINSNYTVIMSTKNFKVANQNVWYTWSRALRTIDNATVDLVKLTTDGGLTWVDITQNLINASSSNTINHLQFTSALVGYASANNGAFIKTIDGGNTWTALSSVSGTQPDYFYFIDDNKGYFASLNGIFYLDVLNYTNDGGATFTSTNLNGNVLWNDYDTYSSQIQGGLDEIWSINFLDENNGIVTGQSNNDWQIIVRTNDGGQTWVQDSLSNNVDGNNWWPYTFNTKMVSTTSTFGIFDGELVGFGNPSTSINKLDLTGIDVSIYPNPNEKGVLNISSEGKYDVSIFNTNGQFIKTIFNQNDNSTIDISDLKQGVYFVQVVGEENNSTQKLIVK